MGRLDEIVVDCAEPARLARFWAALVGGLPVDRAPDWSYVDPPGGQPRLAFQRVPEGKQSRKNRLHLDIDVPDIATARTALIGLGARAVGEVRTDDQGAFQVMLDPEGNEFCLVR
ncbi:VOC family protein [Streptacidiphilus sp. PB12-B1b]|uniref:VOC family protein n=1 Tax=Streptacidiphilus sp. PB12-B1b TaxID=2705012 RepID=UPI0015FC0A6A|nr:VOC family protein [Streptacidiphilus sp. PB12-B1b]QMU80702.1 VOC family protein [Streptacidiphilus sp. PB12-B1b]